MTVGQRVRAKLLTELLSTYPAPRSWSHLLDTLVEHFRVTKGEHLARLEAIEWLNVARNEALKLGEITFEVGILSLTPLGERTARSYKKASS